MYKKCTVSDTVSVTPTTSPIDSPIEAVTDTVSDTPPESVPEPPYETEAVKDLYRGKVPPDCQCRAGRDYHKSVRSRYKKREVNTAREIY